MAVVAGLVVWILIIQPHMWPAENIDKFGCCSIVQSSSAGWECRNFPSRLALTSPCPYSFYCEGQLLDEVFDELSQLYFSGNENQNADSFTFSLTHSFSGQACINTTMKVNFLMKFLVNSAYYFWGNENQNADNFTSSLTLSLVQAGISFVLNFVLKVKLWNTILC